MRGTWSRMLGALSLACISAVPAVTQSLAPDFSLPQVRGGLFHLREHPGQTTLLAFLETVPDTADTPSRREVVFVSSMAHQYGPRGLRVAAIDASALVRGRAPQRDALVNASYDWHLEIPLLVDTDNRVARAFSVTRLPTIILLAPDGSFSQRWDGFTRPAALAQGIERLLGGPLGSIPKIR
jgi:hypothetical protein